MGVTVTFRVSIERQKIRYFREAGIFGGIAIFGILRYSVCIPFILHLYPVIFQYRICLKRLGKSPLLLISSLYITVGRRLSYSNDDVTDKRQAGCGQTESHQGSPHFTSTWNAHAKGNV